MNKSWSSKRMIWKAFIALFGFVIFALCVFVAINGFQGALSPFLSGSGWLFYAMLVLCMAISDTIETIVLLKIRREIKKAEE